MCMFVCVTFNSVNEKNHFVTKYGSFECAHNITFDDNTLFLSTFFSLFSQSPSPFFVLYSSFFCITITGMFIFFSYIRKYFFDKVFTFCNWFAKISLLSLKKYPFFSFDEWNINWRIAAATNVKLLNRTYMKTLNMSEMFENKMHTYENRERKRYFGSAVVKMIYK